MSRPGRGRRRGSPKPVGTLDGRVLDELGLDVAASAFRVGQHWADAVGAAGAEHSRPLGLRDGVLEVAVDSSAWCQQLQLRRREILEALASRLGGDAPHDLRFRLGYTAAP